MTGEAGSESNADPEQPAPGAPYRNLWVPLIVVPAAVVGIIVLVFALFGQITGSEAGVVENLERMISGGENQRDQAAFNLVRQVMADAEAVSAGREPEWPASPAIEGQLDTAWEALGDEDDLRLAFVVAMVTARYGLPQAEERLGRFLTLPPEQDPGELRVNALEMVAVLGATQFAPIVRALVDDQDHGVRLLAVATLQTMPGEESRAVLRRQLDDPSLEIRAMAAISLSHHGDPAGAALLRDLSGEELYAAVRQSEPRKYADPALVRSNRKHAVEALGRLGRPEDRALLEGLAASEGDIEVREAALRALERLGASDSE